MRPSWGSLENFDFTANKYTFNTYFGQNFVTLHGLFEEIWIISHQPIRTLHCATAWRFTRRNLKTFLKNPVIWTRISRKARKSSSHRRSSRAESRFEYRPNLRASRARGWVEPSTRNFEYSHSPTIYTSYTESSSAKQVFQNNSNCPSECLEPFYIYTNWKTCTVVLPPTYPC